MNGKLNNQFIEPLINMVSNCNSSNYKKIS
jgi:hypothetical protein